jgi:hypothetical protein
MMRVIVGVAVFVWLLVGVAAAVQRDYFSNSRTNCAEVGTVAVTLIAGPLNYMGANPKIECDLPEPST